ncbi:MAG: glycoside hydrolase family 88 protein [Bryobacteraceae bacterium]
MMTRRTILTTPALAARAAARDERVMTIDLRNGGPYAFPPRGKAYRENAASHRVWRRVLNEAPDAIVVPGGEDFGLSAVGVPVVREMPRTVAASALHAEQSRRMARKPGEWMAQLAGQYGQELRDMVYTLSFSVWGRLRAGQLAAVRPILEPFLDGRIDSLAKPTASHYSGHLTLAALFDMTGDARAKDRVIAAARLARQNPLHNEMSDAVFMVCPLLAKAGRFTGDPTFFDSALSHFELMRKLCLRADGLYRHSPLDEAAWGRGNAFPLLGLTLTLTDLPATHAAHAPLREAYEKHAARLLTAQTRGGCWRQVVDKDDAWEEFTATAMIGWAMQRGIRQGWLRGKRFQSSVQQAWMAVQRRTGADGTLIDVCESTGKQKSLADYYNREAILGKDPRGGAMALQFAAEISGAKA